MLDAVITWAGVNSNQGVFRDRVFLKKEPDLNRPKRKIEVFNVPGRNGDIIVPQNAWDNFVKQYTLFLKPDLPQSSLQELSRSVAEWLCSPIGYNTLIESYDPDYFYLAYLSNEIQIANHLQRFGSANLSFNCRPEKFLVQGAVEQRLTGNTIINPTSFASKPLLRLVQSVGGRSATITINDTQIAISTMTSTESRGLCIDCDTMNAYSGTNTNRNNRISLNNDVFPVLNPGSNTISYTGDIGRVYITPRWWTI